MYAQTSLLLSCSIIDFLFSLFEVIRKVLEVDIFTSDSLVHAEHSLSLAFEVAAGIERVRDEHLVLSTIGSCNELFSDGVEDFSVLGESDKVEGRSEFLLRVIGFNDG